MPVNEYLPWATSVGANVEDHAAFVADADLALGFQTGRARSQSANTLWRQHSVAISAMAQMIVDTLAVDVQDDGDVSALKTKLIDTIAAIAATGGTNPVLSGLVTIAGALSLTGVISPAQITGTVNDYTPTGYSTATTLRLTTDASRTMTGLLAPAAAGGVKVLRNIGSNDLVLATQNSGSAAANRFDFGFDRTLSPGRSIILLYDGVASRWRDLVPTRKATTAELLAGVSDEAFITPLGMKNAMAAQTLTDASTIAWDMNQGFRAKVTLGGNRTLGQPTNLQEGATGSLLVKQDGTGSRTLAYAACWDFRKVGSVPLSTGANKLDVLYYDVVDAVTPQIVVTEMLSA